MATVTPNSSPSDPLQQPDLGDVYQQVYDLLEKMYWEASDLSSKDLVFGAREAVGEIIDDLDQQELRNNQQAMQALRPKFADANKALKIIQEDISNITKNVSTAASAVTAISKVLSLVPALPL